MANRIWSKFLLNGSSTPSTTGSFVTNGADNGEIAIPLRHGGTNFYTQAVFTGSPLGVLTLQVSADDNSARGSQPVNFSDRISMAVSGTQSEPTLFVMKRESPSWVRYKWVASPGSTGTVEMVMNLNQD